MTDSIALPNNEILKDIVRIQTARLQSYFFQKPGLLFSGSGFWQEMYPPKFSIHSQGLFDQLIPS